LSDFRGASVQAPKTKEAIQNPKCGWFYTANQTEFKKIPGSPIGYWISENTLQTFCNNNLESIGKVRQGFQTGNNPKYLRLWSEVNYSTFYPNATNTQEFHKLNFLYAPHNKGGEFRRWYGNNEYVVKFNLVNYQKLSKEGNCLPSRDMYFIEGITWTDVSSGSMAARYSPQGFTFSATGACAFPPKEKINYILALLNSKFTARILEIIAPTLHFSVGDIKKIPVHETIDLYGISTVSGDLIYNSQLDWDSRETSWDFIQNELIKHKSQDIEETYELYKQFWKNKFHQLHKNEEELNRQFIKIYGLQEELTPDVPSEEITILKEETSIENGEFVEIITLKKNTPGVCEIYTPNSLDVSFESGENRKLKFIQNEEKKYQISAIEWKDKFGKFSYDTLYYYIKHGGEKAKLKVKKDNIFKYDKQERVIKGRTVSAGSDKK
jgi:hypothetical protein